MPSPADVFLDIESDRLQRESELRLLENFAARSEVDGERNMLLRSLILLTYAHLEGFCKFALLAYAAAINSLGLQCRDVSSAVAAASLRNVFAALRDLNSKHPEFGSKLPDDRELHMLWRERTFVESYSTAMSGRVEIPDRVIDTKSNLNSVVLKRNLYQLGLDYPVIDESAASINKLLNVRNAIAHGDSLKVPTVVQVKEYTSSAFEVMQHVQNEVFNALSCETYRCTRPEQAA